MELSEILRSKKAYIFVVAGLILGLSLLLFDKSPKAAATTSSPSAYQAEDYTLFLEEKLEKLINEIDGVSNASVMITLKSGSEYVYASDVYESDEKHVIVDDGLVCVKENLPEIEGVAVVCKGGNNAVIKEKITDLVCSLLGLYTNHVYVTE